MESSLLPAARRRLGGAGQASSNAAQVARKQSSRTKKWAPKVKSGCMTCRKRRVKCDETKPLCRKCTRNGHICKGYEDDIYIAAAVSSSSSLSSVSSPINHFTADFHQNASPKERQIFQAFRLVYGPSYANVYDHDFWTRDVLHACEISPAVWHIAIAKTAQQLQNSVNDETSSAMQLRKEYNVLSLTHYNKAVKQLVDIIDQDLVPFRHQEILIICSVIGITIATERHDPQELLIHAYHSLQLFYSWRDWHESRPGQTRASGHLLTKASSLEMMKCLELGLMWSNVSRGIDLNYGTRFTSINDAFKELELIASSLYSVYRGGLLYMACLEQSSIASDARYHYCQALQTWQQKYTTIVKSLPQPVQNEELLRAVIQTWLRAAELALSIDPCRLEQVPDSLTSEFDSIVTIAEEILKTHHHDHRQNQADATESSTQDTTSSNLAALDAPLYFVALHCREGKTRRRAIACMGRLPRFKGRMHLGASITLAETRMHLEESGALAPDELEHCKCMPDEFICYRHRVSLYNTKGLKEGKAKFSCWSRENYVQGGPPLEVVVFWRDSLGQAKL